MCAINHEHSSEVNSRSERRKVLRTSPTHRTPAAVAYAQHLLAVQPEDQAGGIEYIGPKKKKNVAVSWTPKMIPGETYSLRWPAAIQSYSRFKLKKSERVGIQNGQVS